MHRFPIKSDKFSFNYARFLRKVRDAVQHTYEEEQKENGITHEYIAEQLGLTRSTVTKRLQCEGNLTLKSLSDLYVAMGREPLENFKAIDVYEWEDNVGQDNILAMASWYFCVGYGEFTSSGIKNNEAIEHTSQVSLTIEGDGAMPFSNACLSEILNKMQAGCVK
ncbi:MAG: hypothetical protein M3Z59_05720 [Bombella apis]|nr:hypothetical protein [Bombella apis]